MRALDRSPFCLHRARVHDIEGPLGTSLLVDSETLSRRANACMRSCETLPSAIVSSSFVEARGSARKTGAAALERLSQRAEEARGRCTARTGRGPRCARRSGWAKKDSNLQPTD